MTGSIRSMAVSGSPLMSNWTSAEWPSLETASLVTLATTCCLETVLATSATAAWNAGSSTVVVLLWTSTISRRLLREARVLEDLHRLAALAVESSGRPSAASGRAEPPIMNRAMISASHPKMAVLR